MCIGRDVMSISAALNPVDIPCVDVVCGSLANNKFSVPRMLVSTIPMLLCVHVECVV